MPLFHVKLVQSSILQYLSTAKYVAYLYTHHQYKNLLLSNLSQSQIQLFISLLDYDPKKAITLFKKRLFTDLPIEVYKQYDIIELEKIITLLPYSSDLLQILPLCNLQKINKHNVCDIVRYYHEFSNLRSGPVQWGPGNHIDIGTNIQEHYIKHVLSKDEDWNFISSVKEYQEEAQNMFCKMERIVIHSNGKSTYMSGFYNKYFIVGRYHQGIFGISSCYYVSSGEKLGRYTDQCVRL